MTSSRRLTTLAAALVAAILLGATATARAATVDDETRFVAAHKVKIASSGFDFGSRDLLAGTPQRSGELAWWVDDDNAPLAALDGYLHLSGVEGACARMRLRYKTSGGALVAERFGGTVCVDDDDHHVFDVSLSPYADRKVHRVEIALMRQFASSGWSSVGSTTVAVGPYTDAVKLTTNGFDLGSDAFLGSGPSGSGMLAWRWTSDGIEPHLDATLHLTDVAGACARVRLDDYDVDGYLVGSSIGGGVCATDDSRQEWTVDLGTFADWDVVKTRVSLQTLGIDGIWRTAASESEYASSDVRIRF